MGQSARAVVALVTFVSSTVLAASPSTAISESEAVRLFLAESPHARQIELVGRSAEAGAQQGALLANPELSYQVEEAAGVRDEFLTLQQEIPITGRRGLFRARSLAASSAAVHDARSGLRDEVHELRAAFHDVLRRERAVEILARGRDRMSRIVRILDAREREGESAGYDLLRAEQELSEIDVARSEADAALAVARSRFGSFFDPKTEMHAARLDGEFELSSTVPNEATAIEQALTGRGELRALRATADRLSLEERAAGRRRYPEPTVSAGWKRTDAPDQIDTGYFAAVTVPLPIFDRGQLEAARAGADKRRTELRIEILRREIRAEASAAIARESAARRAMRHHGETVVARADDLRRIAELAYEEGEAGVLELLDAYRTTLATELRALDLRYAAKVAEIDRDRVLGIEVTP
jgi:cobalt-zinc-cadmium efflux system outer membrane protein